MNPNQVFSTATIDNYIVWCTDGTIGRDIIGKVSYCSPARIEYAELSELERIGIRKVINHGINDWGFSERTIYCDDDSVWDYIPEDRMYEKRNSF